MIADASLDLALTWDTGNVSPYAKCLGLAQMHWIGPLDIPAPQLAPPLPLVLFDAPCLLRSAAPGRWMQPKYRGELP